MPKLESIPMIAMAPEFQSARQADIGSASASDDWGYGAALPYLSVDSFETPPDSQERN